MRFPPPDPKHRGVLDRVLARARTGGVVVFDLDSTLLDNRPRQVRILREYGEARGIPELSRSELSHWPDGFGLKAPMLAAGLSEERIVLIAPDARAFWTERFFTSEYCCEDGAVPGAPEYVQAVVKAGAMVAYCTGRPEAMRPGTEARLADLGFPVPGQVQTVLLMKPALEVNDDLFKAQAHEQLKSLGTVVAAFDNEPTHVNEYHRAFPDALVVHLATDHSGRPVAVADAIPAVPDFLR